jgi:hypothetical protein
MANCRSGSKEALSRCFLPVIQYERAGEGDAGRPASVGSPIREENGRHARPPLLAKANESGTPSGRTIPRPRIEERSGFEAVDFQQGHPLAQSIPPKPPGKPAVSQVAGNSLERFAFRRSATIRFGGNAAGRFPKFPSIHIRSIVPRVSWSTIRLHRRGLRPD